MIDDAIVVVVVGSFIQCDDVVECWSEVRQMGMMNQRCLCYSWYDDVHNGHVWEELSYYQNSLKTGVKGDQMI